MFDFISCIFCSSQIKFTRINIHTSAILLLSTSQLDVQKYDMVSQLQGKMYSRRGHPLAFWNGSTTRLTLFESGRQLALWN